MSPPIHAASVAAWRDEAHVVENRRLYREKFATMEGKMQADIVVLTEKILEKQTKVAELKATAKVDMVTPHM